VAVNRLTPAAWWKALELTLDQVESPFLTHPTSVRALMLDAAAMERHARNPEYHLTAAFLADAAARGHRCLALFEGDTLASYAWYATSPVRLIDVAPEWVVRFDPAYAYMFNTFTLPRFRGRRLHAIGAAIALQAYLARGLEGLVCYVEASNLISLRACASVGYRTIGHLWALQVGHWRAFVATRGCREHHFSVEPAPPGLP
jgi:hypothetical protein